ncbi:hypothetical protein MCUN1_002870 [Malassezia cuniculi]|uniref:D-ribulokinase n=1 Tax=Malassezia cuniculi TaxID=948313 RepID=A0AAF0J7S1_9BASI|nr:hypothetical protein MCUN1_002870 [Malassezia cuniculi]
MRYFIGVDVGTGSARAAVFDENGTLAAQASHPLVTFTYDDDEDVREQSAAQIWDAVVSSVNEAVRRGSIDPALVHGIGFDATCSLVVVDESGAPVCVTPHSLRKDDVTADPSARNVILWADHRAQPEADEINATRHRVLDYVGGTISPEMEIPKVLWLKRHLDIDVARCRFFDLPDYLSYRATGAPARSACSLVCKCTYIPPGVAGSTLGWQPDFFESLGLSELAGPANAFDALGGVPGRSGTVLSAGVPVGAGLSPTAAAELGLCAHTPVSSSLIDAYAGWVGTAAARDAANMDAHTHLADSSRRVVAIAGTSTCYCVQSKNAVSVAGVWGPYRGTVVPGYWMNEGGQSSTGLLIDHVIETHPAYAAVRAQAEAQGTSVFAVVEGLVHEMMESACIPASSPAACVMLVRHMTLYPDFYGNRSPLADPTLRGVASGLSLDRSPRNLALWYVLTLEAVALQTRHIIDTMNASGHNIDSIYLSGGGQARNLVFANLVATTTGLRVQLPTEASTSVVRGAAITGRMAAEITQTVTSAPRPSAAAVAGQAHAEQLAGQFAERLWEVMAECTPPGMSVLPTDDPKIRALLEAKYSIFLESIDLQRRWRRQVDAALSQ